MAQRYEYKVVELRESLAGGNLSGAKVENLLNEHGDDGWRLRSIDASKVKARLGRGAIDVTLFTFERPAAMDDEELR